jgi:hypothetical protein
MQSQLTQSTPPPSRRLPEPITFREFAAFARQRGLSVQALADRFRGRIEQPLEFFNRVLSSKTPAAIIPYRSVLEFYVLEQPGAEQGNPPGPAPIVRLIVVND